MGGILRHLRLPERMRRRVAIRSVFTGTAIVAAAAASFGILAVASRHQPALRHSDPNTNQASVASPSPTSSPTATPSTTTPVVTSPRCRTGQLQIEVTSYGAYGPGDSPWLFLLRDVGPGACSFSGAPTISWPRAAGVSLATGLLTAVPANGGRGLSPAQLYGHGTTQLGPVELTPGGALAAFITVQMPTGVKGIPQCVSRGQSTAMSAWLYVTLPGATHSVAIPNSDFAPGIGCWTYGNTTAMYPASVLVAPTNPQTLWGKPNLRAVPMSPVVLPSGTPANALG